VRFVEYKTGAGARRMGVRSLGTLTPNLALIFSFTLNQVAAPGGKFKVHGEISVPTCDKKSVSSEGNRQVHSPQP
jgi:hypothetical protein